MSRYHHNLRHRRVRRTRALWSAKHEGKMVHATSEDARPYYETAQASYPYQYAIYQCRWGDNWEFGEAEPMHWHVGRTKEKW